MTSSSQLICWYCLETNIVGYDSTYQPICQQCRNDLPSQQITTLSPVDQSNLAAAKLTYQNHWLAFSAQREQLLTFLNQTKDLPWRLILGQVNQATGSDYYQASLKTIAAIQDQFELIQSYLQAGLAVKNYPSYDLTPPGRVVLIPLDRTGLARQATISVVVSSAYLTGLEEYLLTLISKSGLSVNLHDNSVYQPFGDYEFSSLIRGLVYNPHLTLDWLWKYPHWPWSWPSLHLNPNFDLTWLAAFPDRAWDFAAIAASEKCQVSWLDQEPRLSWAYYVLGNYSVNSRSNPDRLTIANLTRVLECHNVVIVDSLGHSLDSESEQEDDIVLLDKYSLCDQINLASQPQLILDFLLEHNLVSYPGLCSNASLVWDWLFDNTISGPARSFQLNKSCWNALSSNPAITATVIERLYQTYQEIGRKTGWNRYLLSQNSSFKTEWLDQAWFQPTANQSASDWHWSSLSRNSSTTLQLILSRPEWPWDGLELGRNPNFELSWLEQLPAELAKQLSWRQLDATTINRLDWATLLSGRFKLTELPWNALSSRADLTWIIIKTYPAAWDYWQWSQLSGHPNIAWADPLWWTYQSKWDLTKLASNPATTWARVQAHLDLPWNSVRLAANSMVIV